MTIIIEGYVQYLPFVMFLPKMTDYILCVDELPN